MRLFLLSILALGRSASAIDFALPKFGSKNSPQLERRLACLARLGELTPGEDGEIFGGLAQDAASEFIVVPDRRPNQRPNTLTFYVVAGEPGDFDGQKVEASTKPHRIWKITLQSQDRADLDTKVAPVKARSGGGFAIYRGGLAATDKAPSRIFSYPSQSVWIQKSRHETASFTYGWEKEELSDEVKSHIPAGRIADKVKPVFRRRLTVNDPHSPPAQVGVKPLDPARDAAVIQDALANVLLPEAARRIPLVHEKHTQGLPVPVPEIRRTLIGCSDIPELRVYADAEDAKFRPSTDDRNERLMNEMLKPRSH